jgi:hypothetical protein
MWDEANQCFEASWDAASVSTSQYFGVLLDDLLDGKRLSVALQETKERVRTARVLVLALVRTPAFELVQRPVRAL